MKKELVIEEAKKNSIKDGAAYSVMEGAGVKYITPYALSLGASNGFIGILATFPSFFGSFLRLFLNGVYEKGTRKKRVISFVALQTLFWLPLIITCILFLFFRIPLYLSLSILFISYCGIIVTGSIAAPAWGSWMQDLVNKERGKYFSLRSRITGFVTLVSMLLAGFILDYFKELEVFFGFFILFSFAALGRFISIFYLKKQYEPKFKYDKSTYFSFLEFLKKINSNNFGRFVIFVSLISFGVAICSPFFSVYMLKSLNLSYTSFTIITMSSILSTLLFLGFWGRLSDRYGNVIVFKFCAFFISFIPLLWLISIFFNLEKTSLIFYLFMVEVFSGFVWAGFNLSTSNFVYDAVSRQRIRICLTYFSFLNAFGSVFGGILGGFLSNCSWFSIFGLAPLLSLFLISSVLRLLPSILIGKNLVEVKKVESPDFYLFSFFNFRKT